MEREPEGRPPAQGSVRPGLHHPKPDGPGVVWWDPAALSLEFEEQEQLRHQRILEPDPDGTVAAASEENYAAWKAGREALLARTTCPSMSVRTVTSLARAAAAEVSATENTAAKTGGQARIRPDTVVESVERADHDRPRGRRFGTLVHALLASIDLDAGIDPLKASAITHWRRRQRRKRRLLSSRLARRSRIQSCREPAASNGEGGLRRRDPGPSTRIHLISRAGPLWISRRPPRSRRCLYTLPRRIIWKW